MVDDPVAAVRHARTLIEQACEALDIESPDSLELAVSLDAALMGIDAYLSTVEESGR